MKSKKSIVSGSPSPVTYSKDDVEIIQSHLLYRGFFSLKSYQFRHRLFNGDMSTEVTRELFERGASVALLPYDPLRDEVVLIEQFRLGAIHNSPTPWLLEIIAGMVKPQEILEQVARREAKEEAGIEIDDCKFMLSYLNSPGGIQEGLSIFVGKVDATTAEGVHGLKEEQEDIRVHVVSREQAILWVDEGVINNASAIIALQWLALNHKSLTKEWQAASFVSEK